LTLERHRELDKDRNMPFVATTMGEHSDRYHQCR
jgi:hypothetical protein